MFPTRRGVLFLLLAAPLLGLGGWAPIWVWVAGGYLIIALGLLWLDWRMAGGVRRFSVTREHAERLSLGANNPVVVQVSQTRPSSIAVWVRDEAPEAFGGSPTVLQGELPERGVWKETYYLRPRRRGDYRFGDLNLRWRGPLGLIVRQSRIPYTDTVRVYPNLLDVQRYDLLLRRNRLQEMGLRNSTHVWRRDGL